MKRAILTLGLVVLAIGLVAVAQDNKTLITTRPKAGGTVSGGSEPWVPIFNNLALAYPSGLYYCCVGFLIAGANSPASQPNVAEGLQFTTTRATTLHELVTNVNYILKAGTTNYFSYCYRRRRERPTDRQSPYLCQGDHEWPTIWHLLRIADETHCRKQRISFASRKLLGGLVH